MYVFPSRMKTALNRLGHHPKLSRKNTPIKLHCIPIFSTSFRAAKNRHFSLVKTLRREILASPWFQGCPTPPLRPSSHKKISRKKNPIKFHFISTIFDNLSRLFAPPKIVILSSEKFRPPLLPSSHETRPARTSPIPQPSLSTSADPQPQPNSYPPPTSTLTLTSS